MVESSSLPAGDASRRDLVPARPRPAVDEEGVDLSLIRSNLALTPLERLRRGDAARRSALWLRANAHRIHDDRASDAD